MEPATLRGPRRARCLPAGDQLHRQLRRWRTAAPTCATELVVAGQTRNTARRASASPTLERVETPGCSRRRSPRPPARSFARARIVNRMARSIPASWSSRADCTATGCIGGSKLAVHPAKYRNGAVRSRRRGIGLFGNRLARPDPPSRRPLLLRAGVGVVELPDGADLPRLRPRPGKPGPGQRKSRLFRELRGASMRTGQPDGTGRRPSIRTRLSRNDARSLLVSPLPDELARGARDFPRAHSRFARILGVHRTPGAALAASRYRSPARPAPQVGRAEQEPGDPPRTFRRAARIQGDTREPQRCTWGPCANRAAGCRRRARARPENRRPAGGPLRTREWQRRRRDLPPEGSRTGSREQHSTASRTPSILRRRRSPGKSPISASSSPASTKPEPGPGLRVDTALPRRNQAAGRRRGPATRALQPDVRARGV